MGLLILPWRWHHAFAERVLPIVHRFLSVYGLAALAMGCVVLFALVPA